MAIQAGELVQAAAMGDEAAFTELVARHHRDLLRVAYVICRDPPWRRTRRRRPGRSPGAGSATSRTRPRSAAGSSRSRRTRPAGPCGRVGRASTRSRSRDIELEGVPDLRSDPLADGIANADLRRVLASLDPTDRALIALRYVAELSSDEIGRALGMSSSGARGRLSRLLVRLRGDLRDD